MAKNPRLKDITGQRFGLLTVTRQVGNTSRGAALWECLCDCGNTTRAVGTDLRGGKYKGCGCVNDMRIAAQNWRHGLSDTRMHDIWQNMKRRCADVSNPHYGGKGIAVCPEWSDFIVFEKWARASGYTDEMTIERRNNDLGYTPDNCTWATRAAQAANRTIVPCREDGTPWWHIARSNGITTSAYRTRVHDGWDYERAATQPMRGS